MVETGRELGRGTCCLCLSEDESTFHTNSVMKSLPLHEMVNYCIGIQVRIAFFIFTNRSNFEYALSLCQINSGDDQEPLFSTSICNECVLNINNFYTFKKRVLEAQDLISTLGTKNELNNDETIEYVTEEAMDPLVDIDTENTEVADKINLNSDAVELNYHVRVENAKKRSNDATARGANKKPKIDANVSEKVRIQMNECLICPAILPDILQLKDHIDTHSVIKCKACYRQFARYSNLKRHFNSIHSKPKPFQCDLCGLGFFFSCNLQAHAALHYSGKIKAD